MRKHQLIKKSVYSYCIQRCEKWYKLQFHVYIELKKTDGGFQINWMRYDIINTQLNRRAHTHPYFHIGHLSKGKNNENKFFVTSCHATINIIIIIICGNIISSIHGYHLWNYIYNIPINDYLNLIIMGIIRLYWNSSENDEDWDENNWNKQINNEQRCIEDTPRNEWYESVALMACLSCGKKMLQFID